MCLAVPFKVINIESNGKYAVAEYRGVKKKIRIDLVPNVKSNDYVLVHTGFAMQIIDEESSKITADLFEKIEND